MTDLSNLEQWAITQGYDPKKDYTPVVKPGMFSEHFSHNEFMCNCRNHSIGPLCNGFGGEPDDPLGPDDPSRMEPDLFVLLEAIREEVGKPLYINSGFRCPGYNKWIGGAENSYHMRGMAADFWCVDVPASKLYDIADRLNPQGGVGEYSSFVHVDVRGHKARW